MSNYLIQNELQNLDFIKEKSTGAFLVREDTKAHLRASNWPAESAATYVATVSAVKEKYAAQGAAVLAAAVAAIPNKYYVWDLDANAPKLVEEATNPALEGTFTTPDGVKVTTAYAIHHRRGLEEDGRTRRAYRRAGSFVRHRACRVGEHHLRPGPLRERLPEHVGCGYFVGAYRSVGPRRRWLHGRVHANLHAGAHVILVRYARVQGI